MIFFNPKAPWDNDENKPGKVWPEKGVLKFENYSLKYREELDFVLESINCNIKAGEKVLLRRIKLYYIIVLIRYKQNIFLISNK